MADKFFSFSFSLFNKVVPTRKMARYRIISSRLVKGIKHHGPYLAALLTTASAIERPSDKIGASRVRQPLLFAVATR